MFCLSGHLWHEPGFLQCWALTVASLTVATRYSKKKDSMMNPISVHMRHKKAETLTLLNSGATYNCIDKRTIKSLGLGVWSLMKPQQVHNVDRTKNQEGTITQYCNLWVWWGWKNEKFMFFVTNLGKACLILGHLWFKQLNPTIDWTTNTLQGDNVYIETTGHQTKKNLNHHPESNHWPFYPIPLPLTFHSLQWKSIPPIPTQMGRRSCHHSKTWCTFINKLQSVPSDSCRRGSHPRVYKWTLKERVYWGIKFTLHLPLLFQEKKQWKALPYHGLLCIQLLDCKKHLPTSPD